MTKLKEIFAFGWPYLRKYRVRLIAGLVLGVLFGMSNASFVWATKTLFERMAEPPAPSAITADDISWTNFVVRLKNPEATDGVSQRILSQLPAETQTLVASSSGDADPKLKQVLIADLNWIMQRKPIYDAQLFAGVKLSPATEKKAGQKLEGLDLVRFNRMLLVDAYPKPMSKQALLALRLRESSTEFLDPWLPKQSSPLTARRILGGLLLLPILVFFRGAMSYFSGYCMTWVSERVIKDLRLDLLIKLNSLSMDFFNRSTIGDLLGRVNGDTMALYRCMSMGFSDLIKEPISVVSLFAVLLWTDWKLTLMAIMFVPFIIIPIRVLSKKAKKAFSSGTKVGISQDSLLVEVYNSIRIVKAFSLEPIQIERFRAIYQRLVSIGMKGVQSRELINPIIEVISVLGLGVVIIFVTVTHRNVSNMVGFLTGFVLLYAPIKTLGGLPIFFQQAAIGAERLIQIFKQRPAVEEKPDAIRLKNFCKELTFENVNFAYNVNPVLRDFTLTVPRGFRLGVAGESGSGKSTLMNLIFRFYDPVGGSIKIDGHDLRDISVNDLRHQLALVSQDVVLFDLTVAENIALGKPGATQAEIEVAARASFAHNFIMQLPKGYDTNIGETGKLLSGGQRQRICIARAFIRNAPILVLDEVTGNLDSNTEAEVQAAIDRLAEDRTVICVAHRLATLANTDQIVVMAEGRIIEKGHYKELLRANGPFAELARKQGIIHRG